MRKVLALSIVTAFLFLAVNSALAQGADVFKTKCQMCHSADGSGNSPMGKKLNIKDLRAPEVAKKTDGQLTDVVSKGQGKMQGFAGKLSDAQIKSVVAYVRDLQKKK